MANTIQKESKIIYLQIGQNYENLGVQKQFDVSEWTAEFPDAHIYLLFKRPGEEAAAPVNTTLDEDGILTWTVSNWETGIIGIGFAEIRAIDSSTGLVKKSHVIPCSIEASVTDEDEAPDYPSWVDRMLQFGENVDSIYATLPDELEEGIASIQQEAQTQTAAIEQKGTDTRATIPDDYTTLSDDVTNLKSAVDNISDVVQAGDLVTRDAYILNGVITNASFRKLIYASVGEAKSVTVHKIASTFFTIGFTTTTPAANVAVEGVVTKNSATSITADVPTGAKYVVASVYNTNTDTIPWDTVLASIKVDLLLGAKDNSARNDISEINSTVVELAQDVSGIVNPVQDTIYHSVSPNLFDGTRNPGYMAANGAVSSSPSYFYTNKIDVHELVGETLRVYKNNGTIGNMRFVCVSDETDTVDSSLGSNTQQSSFIIPSGAYYVRLSLSTSDAMDILITIGQNPMYIPSRNEWVVKGYDPVENAIDIPTPVMLRADTLADGGRLTAPRANSVKRLGTYVFYCKPGEMTDDDYIVFGKNGANGYAVGVSKTKWAWFVNDSIQGGQNHGLTIKDYLFITVNKVPGTGAVVTIYTNGGKYTRTNTSWDDTHGALYVLNDSGDAITDVKATWTSGAFRNRNWVFGDSYVSIAVTRWPYYLYDWGFGDNVLINGYSGETSAVGYQDFLACLENGIPSIAAWCLGMNDADNGAINSSWKNCVDAFLSVCSMYDITPILATIPCCPNVDHSYKNAWVRSSGYRYIDFASAVNVAQDSGTWFDGMLSSDNIHPTAEGAITLASQVLTDFPELLVK